MLKYLGAMTSVEVPGSMTSVEGSMDEEVELRVDTAINEMIREASRNVLEKSDFSRKTNLKVRVTALKCPHSCTYGWSLEPCMSNMSEMQAE